jgi:hypothetical protein
LLRHSSRASDQFVRRNTPRANVTMCGNSAALETGLTG